MERKREREGQRQRKKERDRGGKERGKVTDGYRKLERGN